MIDRPKILLDSDWLDAFRRLHLCDAEASGLSFPGDRTQIIALSNEQERLRTALALPPRDDLPRVDGWYFDDSLTGCFVEGAIGYRDFAYLAMEFLASYVETVADCSVQTVRAFSHKFGPELTEALLDILAEGMGNLRQEYRRIEKVEEDDETGEERVSYAPLGTTDSDFEECPFMPCQWNDEAATLITVMEFDSDNWEHLMDEVEQRARAAAKVRRAPIRSTDATACPNEGEGS